MGHFVNIDYFFVRKDLLKKYPFIFVIFPAGFFGNKKVKNNPVKSCKHDRQKEKRCFFLVQYEFTMFV